MKSSVKQKSRLATVLLVAAVGGLASCGSDHDNSPAPAGPPAGTGAPSVPVAENGIPAGAGSSVSAYIAYLRGLRSDETSAPVSVGSFVAPVDEAALPTALGT